MFALWIRCLMLTVQFVLPLIAAINILRKKTVKGNEEDITRLMTYFMVQAVICWVEYQFGLWR